MGSGVLSSRGDLTPQGNRTTLWEGASAMGVVVGSTSEDLRYLKSISLHLWLFGYELPGTGATLAHLRKAHAARRLWCRPAGVWAPGLLS